MSRTTRKNRMRASYFSSYTWEHTKVPEVTREGKRQVYVCTCGYCIDGKLHRVYRSTSFLPETDGLDARTSSRLENVHNRNREYH